MRGDATVGLKHDATKVLLDPYATTVVSRPRWGERGNQDLDYENPEVLGLADTWPQAATPLPDPNEQDFDWQVIQPSAWNPSMPWIVVSDHETPNSCAFLMLNSRDLLIKSPQTTMFSQRQYLR